MASGEVDRVSWHLPLPEHAKRLHVELRVGRVPARPPEFVPQGVCRIEGCENLPTPKRTRCASCQTWIARNKVNNEIRAAWLADQKRRRMLPQTEKRRPEWELLDAEPNRFLRSRWFTDSPFERLMQEPPVPLQRRRAAIPYRMAARRARG